MQAIHWKFSALNRIINKKHSGTVCTCNYCMSRYHQSAKQKHRLELDSFDNKRNSSTNVVFVCYTLLFSIWKLMGFKNSFEKLIQVSLPMLYKGCWKPLAQCLLPNQASLLSREWVSSLKSVSNYICFAK